MKKAFLVLLINIVLGLSAIGQVHLVELDISKLKAPPSYPSKEVVDELTDNEELFAERFFEYYSLVYLYDFAIKSAGKSHSVKIPEFSINKISGSSKSKQKKIFKDYFNCAESLYKEVQLLPPSSRTPMTNKMIENYNIALEDLLTIKKENDSLKLEQKITKKQLSRFDELLEESIRLRQMLDEKSYESYRDLYKKTVNNWRQIVAVSGTANIFQFHDDKVKTSISPGLKIELNPWKILSFWFDYVRPSFEYNNNYWDNSRKITVWEEPKEWKVNLYSVGVQLYANNIVELPFLEVGLGAKIGYGYYWSYWQMYNNQLSARTSADYHNLRLELNLAKHDFYLPVEVFCAYNFFFGADRISLNYNYQNTKLNTDTWGSLQLGMRFGLWRTP